MVDSSTTRKTLQLAYIYTYIDKKGDVTVHSVLKYCF